MEHTNVNSSGACTVSPSRVPFTEPVSPVREYGAVLAELAMALVKASVAVFSSVRRWHRINQTIRELQKLDDRTLADIGLNRSAIVAVAYSLEDSANKSR